MPPRFSGGAFETWLSRQAEAQPYRDQKGDLAARARYQAFADALVEVIGERVQQALAAPVPEWLTTLLVVCQARRSTLLTFNYDPLVECALDAATVWDWSSGQRVYWWCAIREVPPPAPTGWARLAPDGPIACLRLLKLHGSTNWYWTPGDTGGASLARRDLPGTFGSPRPYEESAVGASCPAGSRSSSHRPQQRASSTRSRCCARTGDRQPKHSPRPPPAGCSSSAIRCP